MGKTVYNGDVKELINDVIKESIKALKKERMFNGSKKTAFQKTEQVLYDYNDYLAAVRDKEEKINDIKDFGLKSRSKSIIPMPTGNSSCDRKKLEEEKEEEAIFILEESIKVTKRYVSIIDNALAMINDEPYKDIIDKRYFKEQSYDEIASFYNVDSSTIRRRKSKLINKLSIYLFSDEVISELHR